MSEYRRSEEGAKAMAEAVRAMLEDYTTPVTPATVTDLTSVIKAIPKPKLTELRVTPADFVKMKAFLPKAKPYEGSVITTNSAHDLLGIPIILDVDAPPLAEQLEALNKENNE